MSSMVKEHPKPMWAEDLKDQSQLVPVPQPPEHLFGWLGNLPDLDPNFTLGSFYRLSDLYGPIFLINAVNRKFMVVSSYELASQLQDDDTTEKSVTGAQNELRPLVGDGLLTAAPDSKAWAKAHRLLVPVFGPIGVRKMFDQMLDIASQMILKWDRDGPDAVIKPSDDFTRLTFDTIGICGFNYRFNQFYKENVHPFAGQMSFALGEATRRSSRSALETSLRRWSAGQMQHDIAAMTELVKGIVEERQQHPRPDVNDLLNIMLQATDPVTGEGFDAENIRHQMLTFLIAGHETTSGTLSYLFYHLLKNPDTLHKAQAEVDAVVGDGPIEVKHISKLSYVYACIQEALRLDPPLPIVVRRPKKDMIVSGKYRIDTDKSILLNLKGIQADPTIWGDDAKLFRPDRHLDASSPYPQNSWRPFGVGVRACIGRFFAEQEMILNVALVLQRFQVEMADPSYELVVKQTGTVKPIGFEMKVRRRPGKSVWVGLGNYADAHGAGRSQQQQQRQPHDSQIDGGKAVDGKVGSGSGRSKMVIGYGSNAGTCKTLAEDMQSRAPEHGFDAQLLPLDSLTENIPTGTPTIIFTSSYEGKPPDNARKFVSWLEATADKSESSLKDAQFAVFGAGNTDWANTYQRIPKQVQALLSQRGAHEIAPAFFSNVRNDPTGDYDTWSDSVWAALRSSGAAGESEHATPITTTITRHDAPSQPSSSSPLSFGIVRQTTSLVPASSLGTEKRLITIQLAPGLRYRTGDYLSIQPTNHTSVIQRALSRFGLHADDLITVSGTRKAFLQSDEPLTAHALFAHRVDLNAAATSRQLSTLRAHAHEAADIEALGALMDDFEASVVARAYSVLDVLHDLPAVRLPLNLFLDMLRPLLPRQYSIASSVLAQTDALAGVLRAESGAKLHAADDVHDEGAASSFTATLVYDVHTAPARDGGNRTFHGVASSYLAGLEVGDRVRCAVRATNAAGFHLPEDPSTPVVMIAAGTGIAPMRGFVQERAALMEARGGRERAGLGRAVLYFGCREAGGDDLFRDELQRWESEGVVEVRRAYSRKGPEGGKGWRYVPERMWDEKKDLRELFSAGAKFFICGSATKLARSAADCMVRIRREVVPEESEEQALKWLEGIKETRYVTDVFD